MGLRELVGAGLVTYAVGTVIGRSPRSTPNDRPERSRDIVRDGGEPSSNKLLAALDRAQKRRPVLAVPAAVVKKYGEDGGGRLAATVAYYGFFSVFPALLALVAITGFVLADQPDLRADVVDTAIGQFPVIGNDIADESFGGSPLAVVVGVGGALWAGLGAMLAAGHAFNQVWDVPWHERPNAATARIRGLLMLVVIAVALVAATVLAGLVASAPLPGSARVGIAAGHLAVNIGVAMLAFQILTKPLLNWRNQLPGAVVAGLGFWGFQTLGAVLVARFAADAGDTYGQFALVIGLLTWFHLVSQVTLLAAELNVVLARRLYPRTLFGDELTPGDRRALAGYQRAAARHESVEPDPPEAAATVTLARYGSSPTSEDSS